MCVAYLDLLHAVIRTLSGEHLPDDHAHAVDVCALVVLVAGQHLRGHPVDRTHIRSQHRIVVPQPRQSEVTDLDIEGLVQQQVSGLQVSVDDRGRVAVQVHQAPTGAFQDTA